MSFSITEPDIQTPNLLTFTVDAEGDPTTSNPDTHTNTHLQQTAEHTSRTFLTHFICIHVRRACTSIPLALFHAGVLICRGRKSVEKRRECAHAYTKTCATSHSHIKAHFFIVSLFYIIHGEFASCAGGRKRISKKKRSSRAAPHHLVSCICKRSVGPQNSLCSQTSALLPSDR